MNDPRLVTSRLRRWAEETPDRLALTFVAGSGLEVALSYGELYRRSRAVAAALDDRGSRGERVLLALSPGVDFAAAFLGGLLAGAVLVPAEPPRRGRHRERLLAVVRDATPRVLVHRGSTPALVALTEVLEQQGVERLDLDAVATEAGDGWRAPLLAADDLALLQYTSGSTSAPRGVMVRHGHLAAMEDTLRRAFAQSADTVVVSWLPLFHDMGLIGGLLQPLYNGARAVLLSPSRFLRDPLCWLREISRQRATTSGGPDFAYELCVRRSTPEGRAGLDLSSWTVAFDGAEPVRPATLERFAETFAASGFSPRAWVPCYGLAEATLLVSAAAPGSGAAALDADAATLARHRVRPAADGAPARRLALCGRPVPELEAIIVDPERRLALAPGRVGEVWVRGPTVAGGYWGRDEESRRTFSARLADGRGPFLRTGDLGGLHDGELLLVGRLKDLIIVRGRNHHPHDIEATVRGSHPLLAAGTGAAFAVDQGEGEQVVVVQEVERRADPALHREVTDAARQAVAEQHEIALHRLVLVSRGQVPRTTSGKVRRSECRQRLERGALLVVADAVTEGPAEPAPVREGPRDELRTALRRLAAEVLLTAPEELDDGRPIAALGLDSLAAVELSHRARQELGLAIEVEGLFAGMSIDDLFRQARPVAAPPPPASPAVATGRLSQGQRALWFLHRLAPGSAAYNIAAAATVRGGLDERRFRRAWESLLRRHPALRTVYDPGDGEPVQRVLPADVDQVLHTTAAEGWSERELADALAERAERPFDLAQGPVLRVHVFTRGPAQHVVLLVVHHVAVDLWSLSLLFRQLAQALEAGGEPAVQPAPAVTYDHLVGREQRLLDGEEGEVLWRRWRARLGAPPAPLDLPVDRPRPAQRGYRGGSVLLRLAEPTTGELESLARSRGATFNAALLATFEAFLQRCTGRRRFLLGHPVAQRTDPAVAELVGYLVNPVPVIAEVDDGDLLRRLVTAVHRQVREAVADAAFPFPVLAERLEAARDPGRSPLFDVLFTFQQPVRAGEPELTAFALGVEGPVLTLGDLLLEPVAVEQRSSAFDLEVTAGRVGAGTAISLRFDGDLFDRVSVERLGGQWVRLIEDGLRRPDVPLRELSLLSPAQRAQVLVEWPQAGGSQTQDGGLMELFAARAARHPEAPALVDEGRVWSYDVLFRRAGRVAGRLAEVGVGRESVVGVYAPRSLEAVAAVLGVLRTGAAYLPLDPALPPRRLRWMLHDAAPAALVVAGAANPHALGPVLPPVVDADDDGPPAEPPPLGGVPLDGLLYLLYTSGSTGRPKGVQGLHGPTLNRLRWMQRVAPFEDGEVACIKTPWSFVDSVAELLGPLLAGVPSLVLADDDVRDPARLAAAVERHGVTRLGLVPSLLRALLELPPAVRRKLAGVRLWASSGEALEAGLAADLAAAFPRARLLNLYGSTEVSADVTAWEVERDPAVVPIGRPVSNARVYVLSPDLEPVAPGVDGELYVGGPVLARGYRRGAARPARRRGVPLDVSLFYFASDDDEGSAERYRLLMEGARSADRHGLAAVWTPERHFHAFGGLYPNPSVTGAALAAVTERIAIRGGSVVLPLHHPLRVAEEWAVVDNLSGGRVGISVASGWHARDFVLAPEAYAERKQRMFRDLDLVRRLWRGEEVELPDGEGRPARVRVRPRPVQAELPVWVTAAFNPETFRLAGEHGANVLTHLLGQDLDDLAEKIAVYRDARRRAGHDASPGTVTLMLHAFVGSSDAEVLATVREPLCAYLRSSAQLSRSLLVAAGHEEAPGLSEDQLDGLLTRSFERYYRSSGLFGTVDDCVERIAALEAVDVDEVACLVDFGIPTATALEGIERLGELVRRHRHAGAPAERRTGGAAALTALRFVPDPLGDEPGGRLFRTGDLARWDAGGVLRFRGRTDHQIKVRGVRVEMAEIESALARHAAVRRAAVKPVPGPDGAARLVAFVERRDPSRPLAPGDLRTFLTGLLPEVMVPAVYSLLDALPLTPSGKLDREALPEMEASPGRRPELAASFEPPRTGGERMLAAIWKRALALDEVGVHDNFFDLGGHSLLMVKVHARLQEELGREISMIELFKYPTIAALARRLEPGGGETDRGSAIRRRARRQREALEMQRRRPAAGASDE